MSNLNRRMIGMFALNKNVRRVITIAATTFCMVGMVNLQASGQVLPPEDGKVTDDKWNTFGAESGPQLTIDTLKIDLGTITDNQKEKRVIKFRNTGTGLLTIEKVNTSCGCTAAALLIRDYLPGEGGEIEITYDPSGRKGRQNKIITIVSNDKDNRLKQVSLTVNIKPIIEASQSTVSVNNVIYGDGAEVRVIFSCDWKIFKPTSVKIVGASVSAEIEKTEEIKLPDGRIRHRVTVLVKVSKTAPIGYVRRTLDFVAEVGDGVSAPFIHSSSSNINVNVVGDIQAKPGRLSMGRLNAGEAFERTITLVSRRNKPFEITGVEFSRPIDGQVEVSYESVTDEEGRLTYTIFVKGVAPTKPGIVNGAIRIFTNLEEQAAIDVSLVGSVTRPRR